MKIELYSGSINIGTYRGPMVPFRAKTTTPEGVVAYLIDFFKTNKHILKAQ